MAAKTLPLKTLPLMFACVLGLSFALLGIPTASAVTWNFNLPPGADGTSQSYDSTPPSGFVLTAAGFSSAGQLLIGTPNVNLFGKNDGGNENGVGLVNDPSGDNEISGTSLIRIALGAGVIAPVTFQMNSTTDGEAWLVSGSNSATTGFAPLLAGTDELSHSIPFFNFYTFSATVGNVLLASMTAAVVPSPIVGAGLPGLIVACGGLIALARRRRRRRLA
jgi:hypothetical protein